MQVIITDIMDNRLEVAKSMGATHTYKVTHKLTMGPIEWVHDLLLQGHQGEECRADGC